MREVVVEVNAIVKVLYIHLIDKIADLIGGHHSSLANAGLVLRSLFQTQRFRLDLAISRSSSPKKHLSFIGRALVQFTLLIVWVLVSEGSCQLYLVIPRLVVWIIRWQVCLCADKDELAVLVHALLRLVDPFLDVEETHLIR